MTAVYVLVGLVVLTWTMWATIPWGYLRFLASLETKYSDHWSVAFRHVVIVGCSCVLSAGVWGLVGWVTLHALIFGFAGFVVPLVAFWNDSHIFERRV